MTDEELYYQEWKQNCKDSIERFSYLLRIPFRDLVVFAHEHYPDEYKKDGDFERLYKELLEECS